MRSLLKLLTHGDDDDRRTTTNDGHSRDHKNSTWACFPNELKLTAIEPQLIVFCESETLHIVVLNLMGNWKSRRLTGLQTRYNVLNYSETGWTNDINSISNGSSVSEPTRFLLTFVLRDVFLPNSLKMYFSFDCLSQWIPSMANKWKERVHVWNTIYKKDIHPNSTNVTGLSEKIFWPDRASNPGPLTYRSHCICARKRKIITFHLREEIPYHMREGI